MEEASKKVHDFVGDTRSSNSSKSMQMLFSGSFSFIIQTSQIVSHNFTNFLRTNRPLHQLCAHTIPKFDSRKLYPTAECSTACASLKCFNCFLCLPRKACNLTMWFLVHLPFSVIQPTRNCLHLV